MKFATLIAGIAATAMTTFSSYAQADVLASVKEKGVLEVGTEMQFPPFDFIENGKQVGFNADFFAEIGKELGVKVHFIDLPWSNVLPGLDAKKFDMVAGPSTLTAARLEKYYFSLPIATGGTALLKKSSETALTTSDGISGKIVGVQRDSSAADDLKSFANGKNVTIREYTDNNQAYADLVAGRVSAVANSVIPLLYLAEQKKGVFAVIDPTISPATYICYLGRKDDDSKSLMEAFDKATLAIKKDGRLAAIQKKWFGKSIDVPDTLPKL